MKRCSTLHIIREMQIKMQIPPRTMRIGQNLEHGQRQHQMLARMQHSRNSHLLMVGTQNGTATLAVFFPKIVWQFLIKLNILLPHNLAITLLSTYPKELKTCLYKNHAHGYFITPSFITVKTWKQSRCPLVGEWLNQL